MAYHCDRFHYNEQAFMDTIYLRRMMTRKFKRDLDRQIRSSAKKGCNKVQVNFSGLLSKDEDEILEELKTKGFECKELGYGMVEIGW